MSSAVGYKVWWCDANHWSAGVAVQRPSPISRDLGDRVIVRCISLTCWGCYVIRIQK
jgi:hypothetical protein